MMKKIKSALIVILLLSPLALGLTEAAGMWSDLNWNNLASAQDNACTDSPIVYSCYEGLGCEADPTFIRSVAEMAGELGLADDNYLPCRVLIDVVDDGRFEVPHPFLYLCWDYKPICGFTSRFYASAWTSGEDNTHIEAVQVWLQRHVPNYLPIAFENERIGKASENCTRNCGILPAAGYPAPSTTQEPPYP
jgi:hypothetical protein